MIGALSSALKGLFTQGERVDRAAQKIAEYPIEAQKAQEFINGGAIDPSTFDGVEIDLDAQVIEIMEASNLYKANASVIRTTDEMQDELLDILS